MKCQIPQISWHSRDPVLSIDFQPGKQNIQRLATGGTDSHVLIWYIIYQDNKSIKVECASDLYRHNKSVNAVRFSPSGELLASGDDEGAMFIWQLKERDGVDVAKDEENVNQEDWYPLKLLRGHLEDIYDISWSADSNFLVSASMDNTAIVWDMQKFQKIHIYSDSKGYVQGVAWDPLNVFIASVGSDRALRFLNIATKKTTRVQRAPWSVTTEKGSIRARLFYDDTLKSYFRRLCFTPDGELLLVPSGILEREEEKFQNTTYVFSRHAPTKPAVHLPTGDKYTVAVRCNPLLFKLRSKDSETDKENQVPKQKSMIDLPYRMVFAVAACDSVLLYDTEQLLPFAYVSNIHYTHLTDLSWSPDGRILCASSTDGYCSFLIFSENELGEVYVPPPPPVKEEKEVVPQNSNDKKPEAPSSESKLSVSDKMQDKATSASEGDKKEIVASPSAAQSPAEAPKVDKKPKLCTIKNFFASPKARTDTRSPKPVSLITKTNTIEQSQQSLPVSASGTPKKDMIDVPKTPVNAETMDVDDDSIEVVYESKDTNPLEKKPKCKAQLKFPNDNVVPCQEKTPSVFDHIEEEVNSTKSDPNAAMVALKPVNEPKRVTIKNFFASPKAQLGASSSKAATSIAKTNVPKRSSSPGGPYSTTLFSSVKDQTTNLPKTPVGVPSSSRPTTSIADPNVLNESPSPKGPFSITLFSSAKDQTTNLPKSPMGVVSREIDNSIKAKDSKLPASKPKCKAQLKFPNESVLKDDPTTSKSVDPDLMDCSAVLSFADSKSSDGVAENLEADESDWKLELSQDEDVPTEIAPIAKSPEVKPSEPVTPKPKRRIPLITLSKTVSMSGSKL